MIESFENQSCKKEEYVGDELSIVFFYSHNGLQDDSQCFDILDNESQLEFMVQ
jgi:hypothetical protein